jgi:hypothetical protein
MVDSGFRRRGDQPTGHADLRPRESCHTRMVRSQALALALTRECLAIEVASRLGSDDVRDRLTGLTSSRCARILVSHLG